MEAITLEHGPLRFSARAMGDGPLVLCLHGFPDTRATFDQQLPALAAAGYRAVSVTMRGYEPSSQPQDEDYHGASLAGDVIAWIDQLGADRAFLIGHDWGAAVSCMAAALAPQRIIALAVLSVPHPRRFTVELTRNKAQIKRSSYMAFFQLRGLAEWAIRRRNFAYIERLWRRWSPGYAWPPEVMDGVRQTLDQPGVRRAALSYYRQATETGSDAAQRTQRLLATPITVPTLGLVGRNDGCISATVFLRCMLDEDFPGGLEVAELEGAGHFLHQEIPGQLNERVIDFFSRHCHDRSQHD